MKNITFGRPRGKAAVASELSCPCCYRPGVALCEQFSPADNALKLKGMRSLLSAHGLGGYLVPSGDAHSSEYVAGEDQRREWLTGFTGSAGTALVTPTHALLWTDGRYFVQAAKQLAGTEWVLMKLNEPGVPDVEEWLAKEAPNLPGPVGVDPTLVTISRAADWAAALPEPLSLIETNLVDAAWGAARPPLSAHPVKPHPLAFSGEPACSKLRRVAAALRDAGAGSLILNSLDQIAWLFNLRGSDIECNPVFFSYAVISLHGGGVSATLWLRRLGGVAAHLHTEGCSASEECEAAAGAGSADPSHPGSADPSHPGSADPSHPGDPADAEAVRVTLRPYSWFDAASAWAACAQASGSGLVMLEGRTCTLACASCIPEERRKLVGASPVERFKARKNGAERAGIVSSGQKDAAAIVSYLAWLESQLADGKQVTEAEGADEIGRRRLAMNAIGDSFPTISSSGPNAAVIHYQASHSECAPISASQIYLLDTGGQYADGTTDITRTVHFGAPTDDERRAYTRVLQGHAALARAVFPAGTSGLMLDALARAPLWSDGLNFLHGTGHGMGSYLNVHEGPFGIGGGAVHGSAILASDAMRARYLEPIEEGMYVSDEPGFYRDGVFGVRLESDLLVVPAQTKYGWGSRPFLRFDYCTPVPFCPGLIDTALLSPDDRHWIDAFHATCREKLTPSLLLQAAATAASPEAQAEDVQRSLRWIERNTRLP